MKADTTHDPKKELLAALKGAQDKITVFGVDLLLAIYQRPERTASGLYLSDRVRGEDIYQGKVGLILKVGPLVHAKNKGLYEWFGSEARFPRVGDWGVVRVGDTYPFDLNGVPCRMVEAKLLRAVIPQPDLLW